MLSLLDSSVERLTFDKVPSFIALVPDCSLAVDSGSTGANEESPSFDSGMSADILSLLELLSVVASRVIRGDFEDEYSATSMLGEGKISLIFTSVITGISDTGVISLMVISGLAGPLGGDGMALDTMLSNIDTLGTEETILGSGVPSRTGQLSYSGQQRPGTSRG